ncbi:MAG: hypothetical protein J6Y53_01825 [Alphaproteobacteria bacterium]|nr:hypothetical protein [Alphaproteobacteria bacterium]
MNPRKYRDNLIGIIADVTGCSTKSIWGGTKIDKLFDGHEDDVWLFFEFCERLETEFAIKLSVEEQVQVLDMRLLEFELFLSKKQSVVS